MKRDQASRRIIPAILIALFLITAIPCLADTIQYTYDELNRLIRTENQANGSVVEYQYDAVGNRIQKQTADVTGLRVTVRKDAQVPLQGIRTYLFSDAGSYLGMTQVTDAAGLVDYDIPRGSYKVRADYLGYSFWSNVVPVTAATSTDLTIPHHMVTLAVNSTYQGASAPLSGTNVYLFTPANSYLGLHQQTGTDGRASLSLPDRDYKVRVDYLGRQYFSAVFNAQDISVNIPMAEAEIMVLQAGQPVTAVNVYAFSPTGSYLGITGKTDTSGKVTFRLPASSYKFRADYLGNQYWSAEEALIADQLKAITINTGGGSFSLTVLKGGTDPLIGVNCYVFSEAGSYLGLSGKTGATGQVSFTLSDGRYKFRVDYLGYQHWTDSVTLPTTVSLTKIIDHHAVAITVKGSLAGDLQPKTGVPVYLFSPSGSYLSLSGTTDGAGQVSFNLPQKAYKVRTDYMGQQFWSDSFTWEDKTIAIPEGTARIHVTMSGLDVQDVRVYAFTAGGSYLGIWGTTDASGKVEFRLPAGTYRFRADYRGNQYWATAMISADLVNTIELSTGGGIFSLTIDTGSGPLTGVRTYLFSSAGSYLGLYGASDANGHVSFNLPDGSYKCRVDYLGYQFWSDVYAVPGNLSGSLSIPHQGIAISVDGVYQGSQPIAGINVYLFTPAGSYLGKTAVTDGSGHVAFSLPNKGYKVRADYLGYSFWSGEFQFQNTALSIPRGMAQVMAREGGNPVSNVAVYLFSSGGSYLGSSAKTNTEGQAEFLVPSRAYKFRVDKAGVQHWSAVIPITEGQVNPIDVSWD